MGPGSENIGARITVRLHEPGGGYRDVVGTLETLNSIKKSDGSIAHFLSDQIAVWREIKPVPDRAGRGAPLSMRILELETAANATWPAKEEMRIGGWLLRASGPFTLRANSVLPLGEVPFGNPGIELERAIEKVIHFYQEREIVPVFHIPLPSYEQLDHELSKRGWEEKVLAHVMVSDISESYSEPTGEIFWESSDKPSLEWLQVQDDEGIEEIMGSYPAIYISGRLDGKLIAVVPNAESFHRRLGVILNLQNKLDDLSPRDHAVGHLRVFTLQTLKDLLTSKDFKILDERGFFLKVLANAQMLNLSPDVIHGLCELSTELPPNFGANIGIVAQPK